MIDPVYTLIRLAGLDPEEVELEGISILDNRLIVRYIDNGSHRFVSVPYSY
jgi:hypothetical protein